MHQPHLSKLIASRKTDKRDKPDRRQVIKEWKDLARKHNGNAVDMVAEYERLAAVKEGVIGR